MTPAHLPRLDVALLDRYLAGVCTPGEADTVVAWLNTVPGADGVVDALRRLDCDPARRDDVVESAQLARLRIRLEERLRISGSVSGGRLVDPTGLSHGFMARGGARPPWGWRTPTVTALAAAMLLGGALLLSQYRAGRTGDGATGDQSTVFHEYVTKRGQRATVTLADGSHVILAPQSRLQYGLSPSGERQARLTGEAFFTIAQRTRAPFTVHTGAVITRVLGTAFDVQHYAADSIVRVVVVSGKVVSQGRGASAILTSGMMGRLTDSTAVVATADTSATIAWTHGQLVFTDASVHTMLRTVGQWYGYEFRLADSTLAVRHVTTAIQIGEQHKTLQMLQDLLDVTMTFDGNVITLHPHTAAPTHAVPREHGARRGPSTLREVGK